MYASVVAKLSHHLVLSRGSIFPSKTNKHWQFVLLSFSLSLSHSIPFDSRSLFVQYLDLNQKSNSSDKVISANTHQYNVYSLHLHFIMTSINGRHPLILSLKPFVHTLTILQKDAFISLVLVISFCPPWYYHPCRPFCSSSPPFAYPIIVSSTLHICDSVGCRKHIW